MTSYGTLVSVLTPAHNAQAVITRALRSVQAQSVTDWEMIVIDDGSDDGTVSLVQELAVQDPRLRLIRQDPQQGAAAARNAGLAQARGRYVAFLDADDAWAPDKLSQQLSVMAQQGAALSYSGFARVRAGTRHVVQVPPRVTRAQLLRGNCIGCSTAVYDRAVLGDMPMPQLRMRQDYALWLTVLGQVPYAVGVCAPLVDIHVTPGSLSSNKWRAMQATWRMHHDHFGTGRMRAAWYVLAHTLRRLWRG